MKIYALVYYNYDDTHHAAYLTSRELAEQLRDSDEQWKDYEVEEITLFDRVPKKVTLWYACPGLLRGEINTATRDVWEWYVNGHLNITSTQTAWGHTAEEAIAKLKEKRMSPKKVSVHGR